MYRPHLRTPFTAAALTLALAAPPGVFAYGKDGETRPSEAPHTQVAAAHGVHTSCDCARASHEIEELICRDAELAALDAVLRSFTPC